MNTATNIIVVLILVVLVGFGVWYVTSGQEPAEEPAFELNIGAQGSE